MKGVGSLHESSMVIPFDAGRVWEITGLKSGVYEMDVRSVDNDTHILWSVEGIVVRQKQRSEVLRIEIGAPDATRQD